MDVDRYRRGMTEQAGPTAGTPWAPSAPSTKKTPWGVIAGIVVVLVVAVICIAGSHKDSGGGAIVACHGFVEDQLKSPGSADYSGEDLTHDGSTYTLTGSVDSDNSYGASVRNDFTCVVDKSGSDWTLDSLTGLTN